MSNLVAFDDLGRLGAGDLRSVFREIGLEDAVRALSGAPPALRHLLFSRLGPAFTARIGSIPGPVEPLGLEQVRASQARVLESLLDLARRGVVAFDAPDDMVA